MGFEFVCVCELPLVVKCRGYDMTPSPCVLRQLVVQHKYGVGILGY